LASMGRIVYCNKNMGKYVTLKGILLWSEDYKGLAQWYQEKFGFEVDPKFSYEDPKDTGITLIVGDSWIWCGKHSEVHGANKDPYRIMFEISVESVGTLYQELSEKGVDFIAQPFKSPTMDIYYATFKDLDGNIGQLVGRL